MEFPLYIPIPGEPSGAELDLLLFRNGKRPGFEFECSDAPTLTKLKLVVAWIELHKEELMADWELASQVQGRLN